MRKLIAAILVLGACTPVAVARTWTDSTGKHTVQAEFVEFKDGEVRLKKEDGRVMAIPIEKLSEADQQYVRKWKPPTPLPQSRPIEPQPAGVQVGRSRHILWHAALNHDGTLVATAMDDLIVIKEVATGNIVHTLHGGGNGRCTIAFSRSGTFLVRLNMLHEPEGGLFVWEVATERLRWPSDPKKGPYADLVAMAPNESSLATVGIDINLWDMKSDEPQRTVGPRAASAHVIAAFGPGGTPAAVPDKTPRMHVVPKEYKAIAFSPDSETLAAADRNGIIIRDISIGDPKRAAQKRGGGWYAPEVARLAFSVDGKGLLVAKDKTVGDPVGVQHHDSRGNLLPARKDEPPTLTLWDVATRKALWSRPLPGRVEAISGDGSKAATWDRDVGITLWNAETGTPEDTCREAAEGSSRWGHHWVALSWDGKWVAFPDPQRRTDVLVRKLRGKP